MFGTWLLSIGKILHAHESSKTFNSYKVKVLNGQLVGSNQLLLDVRKNVRVKMHGSKNDKDIVDIGVSCDGSWLTRGHTSNIGVE
ncbi:uncharacterized protein TNCV_2732091 [Trichonephila clavipes]|nr:uncharacterized protein TNCV_2732091 [Trichonephila clavipes]